MLKLLVQKELKMQSTVADCLVFLSDLISNYILMLENGCHA